MKNFEKIIGLSKKIANSIIKKKDLDQKELSTFFDEKEKNEILKSLLDSGERDKQKKIRDGIVKGKNESWKKVEEKTRIKVFSLRYVSKVAAIFIGFLGVLYFYQNEARSFLNIEQEIANNAIVLKLGDGNVKIIDSDTKIIEPITNSKGEFIGEQNGNAITYAENNTSLELVYNELVVPYGKKFKLLLADGTQVNLNSGSSLRYPVNFIKGKIREVFLKGEGLFEVAKDKEHPFIVNVNDINVRVLGTTFNISSYEEDAFISTVLVEGAVEVSSVNKPEDIALLKPGYKASWSKEKGNIVLEEVDVNTYTSWVDGKMVFRSLPFKNMLRKLERNYNVSIINKNESLNNEVFSATFHTGIETVEQVLNYISKNQSFNYKVEEKKIIIN